MRNLRDPALLEYIGEGAIQASVFPIPPGEDRRVEIEYGEILPIEEGLSRYRYPLNTERFSAQPLEAGQRPRRCGNAEPLRAVYSPSHDIAIDRPDDYHFAAGYEASDVRPDTDFELYLERLAGRHRRQRRQLRRRAPERAISSSSPRPGIDDKTEIVAKDVIVVLDTSGSMEGEKIEQAQEALALRPGSPQRRRPLQHRRVQHRRARIRPRARPRRRKPMTPRTGSSASEPTGGTDINLALLNALDMVEPGRPTMILFLTDGLPTEGEVDTSRIISNVTDAAPDNVRLFAFGVGDDVDTDPARYPLQRAPRSHDLCSPRRSAQRGRLRFLLGITAPVLANVSVDVRAIDEARDLPRPAAGPLRRYPTRRPRHVPSGGQATLTLARRGQRRDHGVHLPGTFTKDGGSDFLPRLWATRKIGYLLNQIRFTARTTSSSMRSSISA